jgi:hypothetical protein
MVSQDIALKVRERTTLAYACGLNPDSFKIGDKILWIYDEGSHKGEPARIVGCDKASSDGTVQCHIKYCETNDTNTIAWWALRLFQCPKNRV